MRISVIIRLIQVFIRIQSRQKERLQAHLQALTKALQVVEVHRLLVFKIHILPHIFGKGQNRNEVINEKNYNDINIICFIYAHS